LLDRGIEAGQQHVFHHENSERTALVLIVMYEWQFEKPLVLFAFDFVRPLFPRERVFVVAGDDDGDFKVLQSLSVLVDANEVSTIGRPLTNSTTSGRLLCGVPLMSTWN
jgi:hypothetical protein